MFGGGGGGGGAGGAGSCVDVVQVLVAALGSFFGPVNAGNACQAGVPSFAVYWLLGGCFAWIRWVACYGAFYVSLFCT